MELRQPASGDESNRDAASARVANGVANRAIQHAIHGDSAVIVERQRRELHRSWFSRTAPVFRRSSAGRAFSFLSRAAGDFSRRGQAEWTLTLLPARRSASVRTDGSSSQRISPIPGEKHDQ